MSIKVFGMENCAGCTTVKTVLHQKGVEFLEYDVNKHEDMEEAMVRGVRSVPTTVITLLDGSEEVFIGASESVIKSILLHASAVV